MFGAACKGLHCAGCGKGIPLSIVVVLMAIAIRGGSALGHAIAEALIMISAAILFAIIATPIALHFIMRDKAILAGRWEGETMAEVKGRAEMPEWPYRAAVEGNPFIRERVQAMPETIPVESRM